MDSKWSDYENKQLAVNKKIYTNKNAVYIYTS